MKRCPACDSIFPAGNFCELDGTPLVAADTDSEASTIDKTEPKVNNVSSIAAGSAAAQAAESWKPVAIVAVGGVAIGLAIFLVYYAMTRQPLPERSSESSNSTAMQQQAGALPPRPSPVLGASPSVEPTVSPSATPSPAQIDPGRRELSSGQISTSSDGKDRHGPVVIRLIDGASIEAETAWETSEGIWYRRSGIVALLDRKQVKAIEPLTNAGTEPPPLHKVHTLIEVVLFACLALR